MLLSPMWFFLSQELLQTSKLSSLWSETGDMSCPAPCCKGDVETLEYLLLHCSAHTTTRIGLVNKWRSVKNPAILKLVTSALQKPASYLMQFILDASVLPEIRCVVCWCFFTDNNTTQPSCFVLFCFVLLVALWQLLLIFSLQGLKQAWGATSTAAQLGFTST